MQAEQGSRAANDLFISRVPVHSLPIYNDAYYRDVFDYNIGMLLYSLGEVEVAAKMIDDINLLPSSGAAQMFSDQQFEALQLFDWQMRALKKNCPAFLITALPKSGSASLAHQISDMLDIPIMRVSLGQSPRMPLVRSWLRSFIRGGAVSHDHFEASNYNLAILKELGVDRVIVQTRDPRSAAWSLMKMKERYCTLEVSPAIYDQIIEICRVNAFWLAGWIEAERAMRELKITWVHYEELSAGMLPLVERLFEPHGYIPCVSDALIEMKRKGTEAASQNLGDKKEDAWREYLPEEMKNQMWEVISPEVRDFLKLSR